jgi:hypothetical protein
LSLDSRVAQRERDGLRLAVGAEVERLGFDCGAEGSFTESEPGMTTRVRLADAARRLGF